MNTENEMTYAQAMVELELIVSKMQNNECAIDDLRSYTGQALELLLFCKSKLFDTDEGLKKILSEIE